MINTIKNIFKTKNKKLHTEKTFSGQGIYSKDWTGLANTDAQKYIFFMV